MSVYLVTSRTGYRSHPVNTVFEAVLDEPTDRRAIKRGALVLVERSQPSLKAGSYRLPRAQARTERDTTSRKEEAPS